MAGRHEDRATRPPQVPRYARDDNARAITAIDTSSARETLERVRAKVAGVQVSAPLGRVDLALQVFEGLVSTPLSSRA